MSARFRFSVACLVCAIGLIGAMARTNAQGLATPEGKIWKGVYTSAQATEGEANYGAMCGRCHANDLGGGQTGASYAPALGGEKFLGAWESRTAGRLFRTIRDTMPRGNPGSLSDQNAAEIVAFILKTNGFPAGSTALATDAAALDDVVIIPRVGAVKRVVSNFATVQTSGCLATGAGGALVLTRATDPVVATVGAQMQPLSTTSGDQTLHLVSAAPFKLDSRVGEQVMVKGIIRRDPDETMLTLLAVQPSGTRCN